MGAILSSVRLYTQGLFTRVGARLSTKQIHFLNATINYLEAGRWLRAHGFASEPRVPTRPELHRWLAKRLENERVLYLEFGVYRGDSIRRFAAALPHPAAEFHGFDTFEGLPEDWDPMRPKGTFSVNGQLPEISDPRVHFHKGLFQQTLPLFLAVAPRAARPPEHDRRLIHIDADLYSSAAFVLCALQGEIRPGTILLFDEFCDRMHEMRAFEEYLVRTRHKFRFLCGTANLGAAAFQRVA